MHYPSIKQMAKVASGPRPVPRGYRLAAVAVLGRRYWCGANSCKTHPEITNGHQKWPRCVHAELAALLQVPEDIRHKVTLFVARFTRAGKPAMAKPCEECQFTMKEWGVRRVVFTNESGEWCKL